MPSSARRAFLPLLAAGAALAAPSAAIAAHRATVICGQTLIASVRLANDLTDCPHQGLIIGADGITVDLAGHTLGGTHSGDGGIDDFAGHSDITVVDGTVRDFTFGVALADGARGNRIAHVAFTGADGAGVLAIQSSDNRIQRDTFSRLNTGVEMFGTSGSTLERNAIINTTGAGIEADAASSNNVIANNRIARTADVGIILAVFDEDPTSPPQFPTHNLVARNTVQTTSLGILLVEANNGEVSRNTITDAGTFGDSSSPGVGIGLDGGDDNLIAANVVTRSRGDGIQIGADPGNEPHPLPPSKNRLTANLSTNNGRDGIRVNAIARDTALARNVADGNAALGINAIAPVIDLGGNSASANGGAAQCAGVLCLRVGRRER